MSHILIRCDASLAIGSGHVMRCRTLARELQRRGASITFLCRRQAGDLIAFLEQDFQVLPLPELPLALCEGLAGRELYGAWLGCSQNHADCLTALGGVAPQIGWWWITTAWMPAEAQLLYALAHDKGTPSCWRSTTCRSTSGGSAAGSEFLRCGHRPALSGARAEPLPTVAGSALRPVGA